MKNIDVVELLKSKDMSITQNRIDIVNCLMDDTHFHTIHEIVDHVGSLNVKSVYNNIKALMEAGIVDSYSFGGISKYALNDNLNSYEEIHLVSSSDVSHLKIDKKIFNSIEKSVEANGKKVKGIKIFVEVE